MQDLNTMLFQADGLTFILAGLGGFALGLLFFMLYYQKKRHQLEAENQLLTQQCQQTNHEIQIKTTELHVAHQKLESLQQNLLHLNSQLAANTAKLQEQRIWQTQNEKLNQELKLQQSVASRQQAELSEMATRLQETRRAAAEKQQLLLDSEQRLSEQFEILANRVFDNSHRRVDEYNKKSLDAILIPLKEQLNGFKTQVQNSFGEESKERHTLTHEIRQLQQLNLQMAQDAVNLTNALKGNNKQQGNWGEVILNRVLENSGLREGYEYETQVSIQQESQSRQQPDVVVRLPQNRDVIIDAKMTLVAYEKYHNNEDEQIRKSALNEHLSAVRSHVRLLSQKHYQKSQTLRSLDYVLMFIPIEPAFLLAVEQAPQLIDEALQQNIMIVSPSTLMAALRTIHNLWRHEYQNQNALSIAEQAAKLYDKLRLFTEDMSQLGDSIDKAQSNYHNAMKKLARGRGNLIGQAEQFRQWGIEVKKPIAESISQKAVNEFQSPIKSEENSK